MKTYTMSRGTRRGDIHDDPKIKLQPSDYFIKTMVNGKLEVIARVHHRGGYALSGQLLDSEANAKLILDGLNNKQGELK